MGSRAGGSDGPRVASRRGPQAPRRRTCSGPGAGAVWQQAVPASPAPTRCRQGGIPARPPPSIPWDIWPRPPVGARTRKRLREGKVINFLGCQVHLVPARPGPGGLHPSRLIRLSIAGNPRSSELMKKGYGRGDHGVFFVPRYWSPATRSRTEISAPVRFPVVR